ncbi:uncharacterized protein BP5553_09441 [Venustampulla echinocandica]|uniref:BRCT domain-containing protein n=1 Tax=Venustampulla echinocandica TaxID=2656787 RepID=A0A370TCQ3_9HELO|nr:uncharacterized protein BP5553_09441 [Venustampulla echinocandica]RDL32039.1 hypothetical protein BP5553_09441 [Venustampulla echinocandica]
MPPKAKTPKAATATASPVYIVIKANAIDSVHASPGLASTRVASLGEGWKVETLELQGGSIQVDEEEPAPKANIAVKKTKPPAEQRAANAAKPGKPTDSDLPNNVNDLLAGSGDVLSGKTIVVTGVPPTIGRKNAEALVTAYGGKLTKSLSKKTDFVVVGNDAGPKKLEQIEGLNIEILDEGQFIKLLEGAGSGGKRAAEDDADEDDEDDEDEDEEEAKPVKAKKPAKQPAKKPKK